MLKASLIKGSFTWLSLRAQFSQESEVQSILSNTNQYKPIGSRGPFVSGAPQFFILHGHHPFHLFYLKHRSHCPEKEKTTNAKTHTGSRQRGASATWERLLGRAGETPEVLHPDEKRGRTRVKQMLRRPAGCSQLSIAHRS